MKQKPSHIARSGMFNLVKGSIWRNHFFRVNLNQNQIRNESKIDIDSKPGPLIV